MFLQTMFLQAQIAQASKQFKLRVTVSIVTDLVKTVKQRMRKILLFRVEVEL